MVESKMRHETIPLSGVSFVSFSNLRPSDHGSSQDTFPALFIVSIVSIETLTETPYSAILKSSKEPFNGLTAVGSQPSQSTFDPYPIKWTHLWRYQCFLLYN